MNTFKHLQSMSEGIKITALIVDALTSLDIWSWIWHFRRLLFHGIGNSKRVQTDIPLHMHMALLSFLKRVAYAHTVAL
jgi:hypothetical protein